MLPDLYYGISAYNEENNILKCLDSLNSQTVGAKVETLVCMNGCFDLTKERVVEGMKRYPKLNIKPLQSRKGKSFSQNKIVDSVANREVPIAFIDADVELDERCINILLGDITGIDGLIISGAWPVPRKPERMSARENFLFGTLHVRAFYPQSEIAVHDVSAYKSFARDRPQTIVSPEFEKKSRIYFHGRTFMIRNADYFYLPAEDNRADDTFIPNFIHTKHGPGTIRVRFDAIAYYSPYLSIREHYKAYRRVFWDLDNIDKSKEFVESRKMEETRLDWKYILSKGFLVTFHSLAYKAISSGEEAIYHLLPKKTLSEVWHYNEK